MPKFAILRDEAIEGDKQIFYKLYMDGVCLIDNFAESLTENQRKALRNAYTVMNYLSLGHFPPGDKWHKIESEFDIQEAKHKSGLRVYFYHNKQGQIITIASFNKGKQEATIREVERIVRMLPEEIAVITTEELEDYLKEFIDDEK